MRRGGGRKAAASAPASSEQSLTRAAEIQRHLDLTAAQRKQVEAVCEVKPDWSNNEIVQFCQKCNFDPATINTGLINAFEDLRPSEDQSAAQWSVKTSKKATKKAVAPAASATPGAGPAGNASKHQQSSRGGRRPERGGRQRRPPSADGRPRGGEKPARDLKWKPAATWSDTQPVMETPEPAKPVAADLGWGSEPAQTQVASAGGWGSEPTTQAPSTADGGWGSEPSRPSTTEHATEEARKPGSTPATVGGTTTWAGIIQRGLEKPTAPTPTTVKTASPAPAPAPAPVELSIPVEDTIGTWSSIEPSSGAVDEDVATREASSAPAAVTPQPEPSVAESAAPAAVEPSAPTPEPVVTQAPAPVVDDNTRAIEALFTSSGNVILPATYSVSAKLNTATIQFGSLSMDTNEDQPVPSDLQAPADKRVTPAVSPPVEPSRSGRVAQEHPLPHQPAPFGMYPQAPYGMQPYMPYETDPASFYDHSGYGQPQQRVPRPRQSSYGPGQRNGPNKPRRDSRGSAPRSEPSSATDVGKDTLPADASSSTMTQVERPPSSNRGSSKSRYPPSDRPRGGYHGVPPHATYGSAMPVPYNQPYYQTYAPQYYSSPAAYGPPGFRQQAHYTPYQATSQGGYSGYQGAAPRPPFEQYIDPTPVPFPSQPVDAAAKPDAGAADPGTAATNATPAPAPTTPAYAYEQWQQQQQQQQQDVTHRQLLQQQQQQQQRAPESAPGAAGDRRAATGSPAAYTYPPAHYTAATGVNFLQYAEPNSRHYWPSPQ
ncbi:unnamed protein product (mitochondrion) [Plasmodiophora brassicae]|uniref:Uncharacterized protein n=1 Tax=Plasmodiophora brassicae TaxID=37360 RepID=A0A0G4IS84_PLABS|nr:hypothetical protein PBRA_006191 [Plasmodiophora brassicae]SPQ96103.1 unnamed protein product [Plasmodiophora brassicae]